jgi:hypothetical protein
MFAISSVSFFTSAVSAATCADSCAFAVSLSFSCSLNVLDIIISLSMRMDRSASTVFSSASLADLNCWTCRGEEWV